MIRTAVGEVSRVDKLRPQDWECSDASSPIPVFRSIATQPLLIRDGFVFDRQSGSHQHYYRHTDRRRVTVSFHRPGDTFHPETLKRIVEDQAGWTEDDLKRLGLLK